MDATHLAESERAEVASVPAIRELMAMAAVSFCTMTYEVLLTRIASAILLYHFAFLALSLAMLGLGAPGVWLLIWPPRKRTLPNALLFAGLAIPLSLIAIFKLGVYLPVGDKRDAALPLLLVVCSLVPLLLLGTATCTLLLRARADAVGRMYGVDLLGASLGAALVIPLMFAVETPYLIASLGFLPLAAAALIDRRLPAALAATALLGSILWGEPYRLRFNRHGTETSAPLYERWSPTGRITVVPEPDEPGFVREAFAWGWGRKRPTVPSTQLWVQQEGGAGTPIIQLKSWPQRIDYLDYDVTSVAYQLMPPRRACVIGAGGGRDVLIALQAGARDVDAVELNPAIVAAVSGPFRDFSGDLYHLPFVHAVIDEGRSHVTRSRGDYDSIQIAMVDSYAATAAGAYALSESYLYTVEAFQSYWHKLAADGFISVTRWHRAKRELETTRMALMMIEAMRLEGVAEPLRHLAIVRGANVATVIATRAAFSPERYRRLDEISSARGFDRLWPPEAGVAPSSETTRLLMEPDPALQARGFDLSPPSDDRPFFFQTTPIFVDRYTDTGQAVSLLRTLSLWLALLCAVLFFLPLVLRRGTFDRKLGFRGGAYFTAIGLGFMFVEAPLIQWFVLFLGHPSFATTVVIAALLAGAGVGSILAGRLGLAALRRFRLGLPAILVLQLLAAPWVVDAGLALPLGLRIAIAAALLLPTGFAMGFAFPAGMLAFGEQHKPWFWAVNGATSVMGSVLALACAVSFGFVFTVSCGVAVYVGACVLLGSGRRERVAV